MKYIITVLMLFPTLYSFSFSGSLEYFSSPSISSSIESEVTHALATFECSDGAIELSINNVNAPFYMEWSNGETTSSITGLPPGEYCVTVTDDICGEAIGCWEVKCCPFLLEEEQIEFTPNHPACEDQLGELELSLLGIEEDEFPLSIYLSNTTNNTNFDLEIEAAQTNLSSLPIGEYLAQLNYGECSTNFEFGIQQKAIEIEFEKTASCNNDGTITVLASNGKLPYSYSWSDDPNASESFRYGLGAGFYKVVVTDANSCSAAASVYVKESEPILTENMSVFIGASECNEETGILQIDKEPEGGNPPYTFLWSNGVTGKLNKELEGGEYTLTIIDDQGCEVTTSYEVPVDGQPIIEDVVIQNTCSGQSTGAIGVLASSATGDVLNYFWSNGSTDFILEDLSVGAYTVTITDSSNGCSFEETYTVEELSLEPLVVNITPFNTCESEGEDNGKIELTIDGGKYPYTVLWNTGATTTNLYDIPAGDYSATITDDCGNIEFISQTIESSQISIGFDVIYPNFEEVIINSEIEGGTPPYDYLWSNGKSLSYLIEEETGIYSVTVTDQNGCSKSESIDVTCEESNFTFTTASNCVNPFTLKVGTNLGVGPGPFLLKIEKKVNQEYETVEFIQFETQQQLSSYQYQDDDAGYFKASVTNHCGYTKTEIFDGCVDCDYFFFEQNEKYFADVMGGLLLFEMVCPCDNDCGILGLTTDKIKLTLNQAAIDEFNNDNLTGFVSFEVNWPDDNALIHHSSVQGKYIINGPDSHTLTDDEFDNGLVVNVSMTLPYGGGEICNLTIPFEFGQQGVNGYFYKWVNEGTNPFANHIPPYNWATSICEYKCTVPVVSGELYANEPIDFDDQIDNYQSKCAWFPANYTEFFLYEPNDFLNPCQGGGSMLTHLETAVGIVAGQVTIPPNVAIDQQLFWPLDMIEENDPAFPFSCPPHIFEKGYCLFDSKDVYGPDVDLRDPIIASYCKDRTFSPPVDTDGDGIPDEIDPCPLDPDVFCDPNDDDGGTIGGGGGSVDEEGCQTNFQPDMCRLVRVCPDSEIEYIQGSVQTESYNGSTPCIHCFEAQVCRVTDPYSGDEYSEIVGPVTGSVSVGIVDVPECNGICGIQFTCSITGEHIITLCNPGCSTYNDPVCSYVDLFSVIELLQQEGAPEAIELEMSREAVLKIIESTRNGQDAIMIPTELITIPNPSTKEFTIEYKADFDFETTLEVRNAYQQLVHSSKIKIKKGDNKIEIDENFDSGLYIISFSRNNQIISTKHVIHN